MPSAPTIAPAPRAGLAALLLALACGCAPGPDRPDVVVVVVDTLRADRLGSHGNPRGLTPVLDALAAESVRFASARAHAPWTLPSMATLLTSQLPPEHGAGGGLTEDLRADFRRLPDGAETLAEVLDAAGYATAAVTNVTFLTEPFGCLQGFEHVDAVAFESNAEVRGARATTDAALAWLAAPRDAPAFLLVHYFDAHAVYDPPADLRERFGPERAADWTFGTRAQMAALRRGRLALDEATVRDAEALYDGEVAHVDRELERLFEALGADTVLAVTSDHGEEFWDHGGFEHGHTLYDELLRVPWLLRAPGLAPRTVDVPVGLIDLAPTLCELADVAPARTFRGRSLAADLRAGAAPAERPHLAHGNMWGPALTSWTSSGWKLVRGPTVELYDVGADPRERTDRTADPAADARWTALESELGAVLASIEVRRGERLQLDADVREQLGELGYLGAGDLEERP